MSKILEHYIAITKAHASKEVHYTKFPSNAPNPKQ
jgi:hypothetical protein